jgi:hypothetical protein
VHPCRSSCTPDCLMIGRRDQNLFVWVVHLADDLEGGGVVGTHGRREPAQRQQHPRGHIRRRAAWFREGEVHDVNTSKRAVNAASEVLVCE